MLFQNSMIVKGRDEPGVSRWEHLITHPTQMHEHTHTIRQCTPQVLTLSSRDPLDSDPPEDEHGAVMVDMEEADLVDLLPQDEEHCVQILHSLRDVVPPQSRCYLPTGRGRE